MESIVYVLGAGFSAPLGLPVMKNFFFKSKDMYFEAPERYKHFLQVFNVVEELSVSKNYFSVDLFNIEETLSLLEMRRQLTAGKERAKFIQYIKDVIQRFTPQFEHYIGDLPHLNWKEYVFGSNPLARDYGSFVSSLHNLRIDCTKNEPHGFTYSCSQIPKPAARYATVSLNYDLVLENLGKFIQDRYRERLPVKFSRPGAEAHPETYQPPLAKLHGSVDSEEIVPPTWSKRLHAAIAEEWRMAHTLIQGANQLRFVGYSLPASDTYVRYLLESAVVATQNLKSIDVICLDHDGAVKRRFDDFVAFRDYRFKNANVQDYLRLNATKTAGTGDAEVMSFTHLEAAHQEFLQR